jgi:hypothetical protein
MAHDPRVFRTLNHRYNPLAQYERPICLVVGLGPVEPDE